MAYLQLEEERKTMETKEGLGSKCKYTFQHLLTCFVLFCIPLYLLCKIPQITPIIFFSNGGAHMSGSAKIKKGKIGALGKDRAGVVKKRL